MHIIEFRAENIKRLVVVEIRPDERVVQITGKNGQGKTSVLDAIWWAMSGTRVIQTEPIREGADRAMIRLDLGEVVVTRTFNRKEDGTGFTSDIKVVRADGTRFKAPQDVLNSYLGALTFDPLAFQRMKPPEQFDILKGFVSGVDFDEIAKADEKDRETRRVAKTRADDLRSQAAAIALPAGKVPARVDVEALEEEFAKSGEFNAKIEQMKASRQNIEQAIFDAQEQIASLEVRITGARERLAAAGPVPDPLDVADLRAKLSAARETNVAVQRATSKKDLEDRAAAEEANVENLSQRIKDREKDKQKAIAASSMPVSGIEFGDKMVRLNGVPFDQASDAEQLRTSFAIAAALNPELRVIRIRDGSLLDDDAMAWVAEFAEQHDLQVWIERVDGSGEVGFVMEAGRLKGDLPPAAAEDDGEAI